MDHEHAEHIDDSGEFPGHSQEIYDDGPHPVTDEQWERLSDEKPSEATVGMLKAYEDMGLIKLTPDGTGIDHITDFGMVTLYWMSALLSQTLNPTATVRPIRRARDRAFKMTEAMSDLLEFLNQQQAQAN